MKLTLTKNEVPPELTAEQRFLLVIEKLKEVGFEMYVISKRIVLAYLDNVKAYLEHSWMSEPKTDPTYPDEELMRAIEEQAGIPEQGADDFRRSIMAHLGSLCLSRTPWVWYFNPQLVKAVNKLIKQESELPLSEVGNDQV